MGDIGYRRKGETTPLYNPDRDYAYITPTLLRTAIESLESNESAEKVTWRDKNSITEADVAAISLTLADAQRDFVNAADPVTSFEQALRRHGFYDHSYALRQFLFAAIGEVCTAAWFTAVREVSAVGYESPAQTDMARFTAAVRAFVNSKAGASFSADATGDYYRMENDTLRARIAVLEEEMKSVRRAASAYADTIANYIAETKAEVSPSFFQRVRNIFRKRV